MALDMLVDSTALDNGLTTVANAIRTKGGTSEQLSFPSGMAQAIADLPSGGGSLPSSITKIDGGSFTLASDKATDYMWISHNLAEAPKGCMVWTDDNAQESYDRYTFVQGGTATGTTIMYAFRNNSGALSYQTNAIFNTTDTQFRVNRSVISYKAGCTYKWIAWA